MTNKSRLSEFEFLGNDLHVLIKYTFYTVRRPEGYLGNKSGSCLAISVGNFVLICGLRVCTGLVDSPGSENRK